MDEGSQAHPHPTCRFSRFTVAFGIFVTAMRDSSIVPESKDIDTPDVQNKSIYMGTGVKNKGKTSSFVQSMVSGAGAGFITTCLCAPLDVAKVRTQVQGSVGEIKYFGVTQTLKTIFREEGVKGLYRGLGPALCTVPVFWGIYWTTYERLKEHFKEVYPTSSPVLHHIGKSPSSLSSDVHPLSHSVTPAA